MQAPHRSLRRVALVVASALMLLVAGCGGGGKAGVKPPPGGGPEPGGTGGAGGTGIPGPGMPGPDASVGGSGGGGEGGSGGGPGTGGTAGMPAPDGGVGGMGGMGGMVMPPPTPEEPLPPCKRTVAVDSSAALATALGGAQAGDCIVLADGSYTFPNIGAKGTEAAPIVVKAANLLKAVVSMGDLSLQGAAYLVVQGLTFNGSGQIKLTDTDHCRISRFRVQRQETNEELDWITVSGSSKYARIDHNDLGPQNHVANMVMVAGVSAQIVQYTRIDHNFFHDVHFSGGNGWEIIRDGLSGWTFSSAHSLIEQNLFRATASDPEVISVKSSDNIIRYNTMRASAGQFVLRHGNGQQVYGNYILGDGVGGAGGLRVHGGKHKIYNNYIAGVGTYGINLEGGDSNDTTGALTGHKQVYDTVVAFNTIINDRGIIVGGAHPMGPLNCTIAYNLVQGSGPLISEEAGSQNDRYFGNIANGPVTLSKGPDAVKMMDPKLTKMGDLFLIATGSPAIDAGDLAMFPFLTDDIDGRPRVGKPDVGALEVSTAPAKFGLLKETDVGPMAP